MFEQKYCVAFVHRSSCSVVYFHCLLLNPVN